MVHFLETSNAKRLSKGFIPPHHAYRYNWAMSKHMTKKKKPVLKTMLIALAVLGILAIIALALAPQFLARQATQAPADTHTFVTRQIEEADLSQRMQAAVNNASVEQNGLPPQQNGENGQPEQGLQVNVETSEQVPEQVPGQTQQQPDAQVENQQQQQNNSLGNENGGDTSAQLPPNDTPVYASENRNPDTRAPGQIQSNPSNTANTTTQAPPQSRNDVPQQRQPQNKSFEFQISQNEISSMIYSGLVNGTAPAFRQSIQGVSTQISGGRAKISVALLPKYLPDAFLRNLPGITRSTPTVYLGGEMGLSVSGNTVEPRIYRVSLGNMGVPMPFIENAVRGQVQAYVRNATRLPGGQQAQLQNVRLEGGAIHIQGRVN
jgi:Tfp pilus assembly major pilin PilA